MKELRPYKVYAIEEGTVIDHTPPRKAILVVDILGVEDSKDSIITIGMNFTSQDVSKKDIVKIEKKQLTKKEIDRISLIAPNATINTIKDFKVAQKRKVEVPKEFSEIVKCLNPGCVTNNEPVITRFKTLSKDPITIKCHHCETLMEADQIELL